MTKSPTFSIFGKLLSHIFVRNLSVIFDRKAMTEVRGKIVRNQKRRLIFEPGQIWPSSKDEDENEKEKYE